MSLDPHYKIPDSQFKGVVWELTDKLPTHAYVPINERFHLKRCRAKKVAEPQGLQRFNEPPKVIWEISLEEDITTFKEWSESKYFTVPAELMSVVRSDTKEHVILIAAKSLKVLEQSSWNYIPNKWNIPIKPCRIVQRKSWLPQNYKPIPWCEVHGSGPEKGETSCQGAIPIEYMPCDIESDQGGEHCNTHGSFVDLSDHCCKEYKGPVEIIKDDYGWDYKEAPRAYQTCDFGWSKENNGCYTHDDSRVDNKPYCGSYDGPLKIIF